MLARSQGLPEKTAPTGAAVSWFNNRSLALIPLAIRWEIAFVNRMLLLD
jgi:hypothetical protein